MISQLNQTLNFVSKIILDFSKNIDLEKLDKSTVDSFLDNIETYSEKIVVEAIFKLFEEIDDEKIFIKLLYVIDTFLKLYSLPSRTINYLRENVNKKKTMFRLLLLYQSFFFAGYKLEKSITDLFKDLNIDNHTLDEFYENSMKYIGSMHQFDLSNKLFQDTYEFFEIDKIINEINPLNEKSPIFNSQEMIGFNLPKNIDLKINNIINQLDKIYNSIEKRKNFLLGLSEEIEIKSLMKDNLLQFFEARDLHFKGKNNKALILINRVLKKHPKLVPGLILKGDILSELHQHHYALKCYLKSIELDSFKIHAYLKLSIILQIGGYFNSSYILCGHLLKFIPLDFNIYVQLAYSAYQLSKPFKKYLKVAGLLNPERLINFLNRFWIKEKIESKDGIDKLKINNTTVSKLEELMTQNTNNILKFLIYYNKTINNYESNEKFDDLIVDPLYFFPNKIEHTNRNHFIFEFGISIALNMVELIHNLNIEIMVYFFNKEFLKFCFKITHDIVNKILENNLKHNKSKDSIFLDLLISKKWIEDALKKSFEEPYFYLIKTLIPLREFYEIIQLSLNELAADCVYCPVKCLIYTDNVFPNFEVSCSDWEEFNEKKYVKELNTIQIEFEKDFLPILNSFEKWLRDKELSEKTIQEKLNICKKFLKFIFFNLKIHLENFKKELNENLLNLFLKKYIIDYKWVKSKTAMKKVQRGLIRFLSYLSKELNYFSDNNLKNLKKTIENVEFQC